MEKRCCGCMKIMQDYPVCEHCGYDNTTRNAKHQLPAGTIVGGQYLLGKVLGQGGFGITYLGWDTVMNIPVAVKEYFPSGYAGRDPENPRYVTSYDDRNSKAFASNKRRFLREAESLSKLWNIPEIVKVLRYFEENGTAYIAMEYVEGMDLRKYLKQLGRPMTMEETMAILGPVMEALEHVHRAELVHRDISPDNIMVLPDGSAKLLDFGAARYVQNADAERDRNTSTQAILKHGFAPPEQYSSHGALGPWTDVYAMCATIYYCLTGRVPTEAMLRVMEGQEIQWSRIQHLTSSQINALIRGTEVNPKNRFGSVGALYLALSQEVSPQRSRGRYEQPKSATSKHNPIQELSVSFLLVLLAIVLVLFSISAFVYGKLRNSPSFDSTISSDQLDISTLVPTETDIPPELESTFSEPTITPYTPLEIESSMSLENVEYGHTEKIAVISGPSDQTIQWSSSDPRIATVSKDGAVTALGFGTVKITAKNFSEEKNCIVSVSLNGNIDFSYSVNSIDGGITITGYSGYSSSLPQQIIIPREINGKLVTRIGHAAFGACPYIEKVIIPDTVIRIDSYAFSNCTNLSDISLFSGLYYIEYAAFYNCKKIINIHIPPTVVSIKGYAFGECTSLSNVILPRNCDVELNHYAFPNSCSIEYQ
ncbi:MAG: leucine-rich repeat protein [Oscillospiraceae bacterium]|nr:leucine-rich repeat protein [Oscillospiraceae bacterium]